MDPRAIAQVNFSRAGGLGEDVVVNTWHFEADDDLGVYRGQWDDKIVGLGDRLETFYKSFDEHLAGSLTGAVKVKFYDFNDPSPGRIVRYEHDFTIVPYSGDALPGELAVVLSLKADPAAGVSPARRRGRVYLGPWGPEILSYMSTSDPDPVVTASIITKVLDAAVIMARGTGSSFRLSTFSPTTLAQGGSIDESWNDVTSMYVDNALDTQRRRGSRAQARSTRTLPG